MMQFWNLSQINKAAFHILVILLFFSCKKDKIITIGDIKGPTSVCYGEQGVEYSMTLEKPVDYVLWTVPEEAQIVSGQGSNKIVVNFGRKNGEITTVIHTDNSQSKSSKIQITIDCIPGKWCRLQDFPGIKRFSAFSFAANGKGYIGCGYGANVGGGNSLYDLWQFDPIDNTWTQKASGLDIITNNEIAPQYSDWNNYFTINNKFYILGWMSSPYRSFLCYDPVLNLWTDKKQYPGTAYSSNAGCFAANNKGYICFGFGSSSTVPVDSSYYSREVWQYDPNLGALGTWTRKNDFPGEARYKPIAFSANDTGFAGGGVNQVNRTINNYYNLSDLWKYNATNDSWVKLKDIPFINFSRASFLLNGLEYFVCGSDALTYTDLSAVQRYSPITDTWEKLSDFPGKKIQYPSAFVINNKAYLGFGQYFDPLLSSYFFTNEFYSYCP